jgi:hypothetical protein
MVIHGARIGASIVSLTMPTIAITVTNTLMMIMMGALVVVRTGIVLVWYTTIHTSLTLSFMAQNLTTYTWASSWRQNSTTLQVAVIVKR